MKRSALQKRAMLAIRMLSVLALVLVAFAHRPIDLGSGSLGGGDFEIAHYVLPDGSYPVICVTDQTDGKVQPGHGDHAGSSSSCEACRIASSFLCPAPAFSTGAAPHVAMAHAVVPPPPAQRRAVNHPSAPPQAPPLACSHPFERMRPAARLSVIDRFPCILRNRPVQVC